METPVQKLPMSCHVTVNGKEHEVFMSFALLNRLAYLVGSVDQLPMIQINPEMRDMFLGELLAERSKGGKVVTPCDPGDCDISLEDVQLVLDFASEHVLDFTLGALEKSAALQAKNQARMLSLKSSQAGLENSASKS
jgi:hypothetical protein